MANVELSLFIVLLSSSYLLKDGSGLVICSVLIQVLDQFDALGPYRK
jgi:hypothetical protein